MGDKLLSIQLSVWFACCRPIRICSFREHHQWPCLDGFRCMAISLLRRYVYVNGGRPLFLSMTLAVYFNARTCRLADLPCGQVGVGNAIDACEPVSKSVGIRVWNKNKPSATPCNGKIKIESWVRMKWTTPSYPCRPRASYPPCLIMAPQKIDPDGITW